MISLVNGDSLHVPLRDQSVHMVCFSPPYWGLRSYLEKDDPIKVHELGNEPLHDCLAWARGKRPCGECFVCNLRQVAAEVWRVLRNDGTFWLNLGDGYANGRAGRQDSRQGKTSRRNGRTNSDQQRRTPVSGELKHKDLVGIPWRVALALQSDGWYLRNDILWIKENPMPEAVTDRFTRTHEYIFLLSKRAVYFFDQDAVREPVAESVIGRKPQKFGGQKWSEDVVQPDSPMYRHGHEQWKRSYDYQRSSVRGRNRRTNWEFPNEPYSGAHFAAWPTDLVEVMIKAGTSEKGCCPSCGAQWERMVEKSEPEMSPTNPNPVAPYPASSLTQAQHSTTLHMIRTITRTDWVLGCNCEQSTPVPSTVLDLFAGSGTTLVVARQLGRSAVGVDLNFKCLNEQAKSRLELNRLEALEQGTGFVPPMKIRRKKKSAPGQMTLLETECLG